MSNPLFCPNCGMLKNNCICDKKNSLKYNDKEDISSESYLNKNNIITGGYINILKENYPNIDDEIIENFPFKEPRLGQLDIIQDIKEAIDKGFKYIILEAGTGTGKSVIATTLAKIYESAYILTMTKQLQAQYADEFDISLVKGRSNFSCLEDNLDSTCDMGTCKTTPSSNNFTCRYGISKNPTLDSEIAFEDSFGGSVFYQSEYICNYWKQKANAINSPITLMNYDYAILELNYVKHFSKRSLLILDEAHNIENKLMRTMEVNLSKQRLEKDINKVISIKSFEDGNVKDWIMEISAIYESYEELDTTDFSKRKKDRIRSTIFRLKQLTKNLKNEPENWVVDSDNYSVSFKPLKINNYAEKNLFKYGDVCIFLSATILSHKLFCKWLGLNPNEVYHMKVDSPFPSSKRPIKLNLVGKMSASRIKQTAPKTIPILKKILKKHENDKGLIHTNSYKCQNYINNNLVNPRLISHTTRNREKVLKYFEKDKNPLVLVSPSMSEGVDLPYDKCRFQIIYKIPFPYLGDKQVNLRRKKDQRWYAYKTVMNLVQAYGRGMRAEDDYCYTYILDKDINILFNRPIYRSLIPDFFKEAIVDEN